MPRGGYRAGAGRKSGALVTKTMEIAERVTGDVSPLETAVDIMRFWQQLAKETQPALIAAIQAMNESGLNANQEKTIRTQMQIQDKALSAALAAAPFCHPRLSALTIFEPSGPRKMEPIDSYVYVRKENPPGDAEEE